MFPSDFGCAGTAAAVGTEEEVGKSDSGPLGLDEVGVASEFATFDEDSPKPIPVPSRNSNFVSRSETLSAYSSPVSTTWRRTL